MNTRSFAKKALKEQIALTAYEMFRKNGYDKTTVEAISGALGMSARNYFRYFPTKEEALLERTHDFKERFLGVFAERLDTEGIWDAMKNSIVECALHFASPVEAEIQAFIQATPALFSRQLEIFEGLVSEATDYYVSHHPNALSRMTVNALIRAGFSCLQAIQSGQSEKISDEDFVSLMAEMKPVLLTRSR
ncbi:mycofactocin system transcriptional regulator [Serratia ficaria]|uniref:TetR/AcrR family transcriptional regulator n=1 Tax=Enterobacterales TaxID=91347 RepID=UPI000F7E12AE|nr:MULTISPECIES: TetR/AcrR family transcriptional regulator [Enterobacterales]RSV89044.1 TetR family transcriptional regulator [Klebsiella aerogenes]CAI1805875.1 mycofactocin system transcriptional regulator [Serratia ficaria]